MIKFRSVNSTNNKALNLIKDDLQQPTIIISKKQTKGRGTRGKTWISKKGNLFISIFFEFNPKKLNFQRYAVLNAYILRKILSKYIKKKIKIKWPNDLLIEKKKVCGILQETIEHKKKNFLIIGIGVNTQSSPAIINSKTTHLAKHTNKKVDNDKILKDIKNIYKKLIFNKEKVNFTSWIRNIK